ncbi:type VI secretion system protein TssA [Xenorhabdus sp. Reich]|uniref:Type VI secretion system protein TssA n=1 Tax=Xenorhabdus littoralis TaxID=2582835 RepID=A0ABU4SI10_9GAMM|nr:MULTISPECIES: type VI secretion system protein TssA [unclassified Xenorhabdus]MDX7989785.1 type VI secretion system protein TssA [Xenorhabdus sp. psl]MDX7998298.1 type VI secretion system protein TssA [Xenorhabdus sp. Reich]
MNIDTLLTPIDTELACGENLEYDDEFMALEQLLVEKPEQQFGDVIIPAEPPHWGEVEKKTIHLLSRTKDLRIIIALMQSWLNLRGLCGYADGLDLLRQTLERYWAEVWPRLEFDGEYDFLLRLNTLAAIEDGSPCTVKAQHSVLLKSVSDELTLQNAYLLLSGTVTEVSGYTGGRTRLINELKQQSDNPEVLATIAIHEHLTALMEIIRHNLSAGHVPELPNFLKQLDTIIKFCATDDSETGSAESLDSASLSNPNTSMEQATSAIITSEQVPFSHWQAAEANNRDEARMLLEKAKIYFLKHEPSHPAPIMISRIQRLIDSDFMNIILDLAPEGLNQLEIIFGRSHHSNMDSEPSYDMDPDMD